jgi:hypothetical protein
MKKVIIAITLSLIIISGYSQSCLPEGITFETQAQIDSFQINYPNCKEIEGDVYIGAEGGSSITNLNGLNVITSIDGSLHIGWVGGSWPHHYNNPLLTSLSGLSN